MVIPIVVVVLVVCVGGALLAYSRSDKSRHETRDQFLSRREGETLEERYQEDLRKRDELPPTHET
ncbi:hypothetical protein BH10ACT10_BH10ACT10_24090 [soil metagenome]